MPVIAALLLLAAAPAAAHGVAGALPERLPVWLGALAMGVAWGLYEAGAQRRPPAPAAAACFRAAMVFGALAAFGPFDAWAEESTAMHMLQHMLFIVVVAPLGALASPLPQWRAATGKALQPLWAAVVAWGRHPLALAAVHGGIVWLWHAPAPYRLALDSLGWHMLEHASFLSSAWLFWWSVLHAGRRQLVQAMLAVLLTLMHTGLLGALLTFGRSSFYGAGRSLPDQQLAGLLMWVPGGLAYLAGAAWIVWRRLLRAAVASGERMS